MIRALPRTANSRTEGPAVRPNEGENRGRLPMYISDLQAVKKAPYPIGYGALLYLCGGCCDENLRGETGGPSVRRFHARERAGAVALVGANGQTCLSGRFAAFGRTPEGFLLPTFLFLKKKSTVIYILPAAFPTGHQHTSELLRSSTRCLA